MRLRVGVVIPAHNEEHTITQAVEDILNQTYPVRIIVVVNDCSTDNTGGVLEELKLKHPQLAVVTNHEPKLRAGAINCGLEYLRDRPIDLVLSADADSRFDPRLIETAVAQFEKYENLGGVCSTAGVLRPDGNIRPLRRRLEAWLLWRLQRLDYGGFDATRTATCQNVQILHGLCSVFRLSAVLAVGGYTPGHLLEDYDLTLRLKKAGWHAMYCPDMKAWTNVPTSFRSFFRQRLRWMRGGVDILLEHGINRYTFEDFFNHILFSLLFLAVLSFLGFTLAVRSGWTLRLSAHPIPISLAGLNYVLSLYRLKHVDHLSGSDVMMRVVIFPELLLCIVLSFFQVFAYYLSLFKRPQKW